MQILCSTGVFTRSSDLLSHEAIVLYGPQFDVDGFEVIFYPRWYAQQEDVIQALRYALSGTLQIRQNTSSSLAFGEIGRWRKV